MSSSSSSSSSSRKSSVVVFDEVVVLEEAQRDFRYGLAEDGPMKAASVLLLFFGSVAIVVQSVLAASFSDNVDENGEEVPTGPLFPGVWAGIAGVVAGLIGLAAVKRASYLSLSMTTIAMGLTVALTAAGFTLSVIALTTVCDEVGVDFKEPGPCHAPLVLNLTVMIALCCQVPCCVLVAFIAVRAACCGVLKPVLEPQTEEKGNESTGVGAVDVVATTKYVERLAEPKPGQMSAFLKEGSVIVVEEVDGGVDNNGLVLDHVSEYTEQNPSQDELKIRNATS